MDAHEQILDYPVLIANEASLATLMAELSSEGHAVDNVVVVEGKVIRRRKFEAVTFLIIDLNSAPPADSGMSGKETTSSRPSTLQAVLSGKDGVFPAVAACCTVGARVRCKGKARRGDRGVDVYVDFSKAMLSPGVDQERSGISDVSCDEQIKEHRAETFLSKTSPDSNDSLVLVRCAPETAAVERLLNLVKCGAVSHNEAEVALGCAPPRLATLLDLLVDDNDELKADSNNAAVDSITAASSNPASNAAYDGSEEGFSSGRFGGGSIKNKRAKRPRHIVEFAAQARALRCAGNLSADGCTSPNVSSADCTVVTQQRPPKRKRPPHVRKCDLAALAQMEAAASSWTVRCCSVAADAAAVDPAVATATQSSDSNTSLNTSSSSTLPSNGDLNVPGGDASQASSRGPLTRGEYFHGRKAPQVRWLVNRFKLLRHRQRSRASKSADGDAGCANATKSAEGLLCAALPLAKVSSSIKAETDTTSLLTEIQTQHEAPWHVVDVGGGRGDLSLAIAEAFPDVFMTVVDSNESSLKAGQAAAEARGLEHRMRFVCSDFTSFASVHSSEKNATGAAGCSNNHPWACGVDAVVALHACGGLTDHALAFAADHSAPFLVVPCCFNKHPVMGGAAWHHEHRRCRQQQQQQQRHQQQRQQRCADSVANVPTRSNQPKIDRDADYLVSKSGASNPFIADAAIAPATEDKGCNADDDADAAAAAAIAAENVVIRLAESDARELSFRAMTTIGTFRLQACQRPVRNTLKSTHENSGDIDRNDSSPLHERANKQRKIDDEVPGSIEPSTADDGGAKLQLSLEAFPQVFSLRNLVLVGERATLKESRDSEGPSRNETSLHADAHRF